MWKKAWEKNTLTLLVMTEARLGPMVWLQVPTEADLVRIDLAQWG